MASTPSQQAAIECDRNLIMFAGPGSGKTKTSVDKAFRILGQGHRLLMCTFSVDSAKEMRHRLDRVLHDHGIDSPAPGQLRVSTFDSLMLWYLRQHREVNLLSPQQQFGLYRSLAREQGIKDPDEVIAWLGAWQSCVDRQALDVRMASDCPDARIFIDSYVSWMRSSGQMDLATVKRTVVLGIVEGRLPPLPFDHILVDEVQDSDELQMLMATYHGTHGRVVTLVGDDDQTIYEWRSATGYEGMCKFRDEAHAEVIRLGENFRSHTEVVGAASQLISWNNPDRVDKSQRAVRGPGGDVIAHGFASEEDQFDWVAADIAARGLNPLDCAVIARVNRSLDGAEQALASAGIPYWRPSSSIWSKDEIQAFFALLRWLTKPSVSDLMLLLSYLKVTSATTSHMGQILQDAPQLFLRPDYEPSISGDAFGASVIDAVQRALQTWNRNLARNPEGELPIVLADAKDSFMAWVRRNEPEGDRESPMSKRVLTVSRMIDITVQALLKMRGTLSQRMKSLLDANSRASDPPPNVVRLITMHGSKGLEFDRVYLVDCKDREEAILPQQLAAERRVMYVGMTRARQYLRVTFTGGPPLFVREALLDVLDPDECLAPTPLKQCEVT